MDDLKPAPYNPRTIDDESAAGLGYSLSEFGDLSGLTWNKRTGHMVAGHQRVKELRKMGGQILKGAVQVANGDRFAVRVVDWPESKEKAANIVANSRHIAGEFTPDLAGLIAETKVALPPDDFAGLRLDNLLADSPKLPVEIEEDEVPEPPKTPATKLGDVWTLGDHRLVCGDSSDEKAYGRAVSGETPELMVTDPPYGVNYDPNWRNDAADKGLIAHAACRVGVVENDDKADWWDATANFKGGVAYVWHAGIMAGEVLRVLAGCGFDVRSQIIWAKGRFAISRGHYHWQHEPCWYAVRKGSTARWAGDRSQTTLWEISNVLSDAEGKTSHGTQKPLECMARPIRNHDGDVYDPFLGSGTTLIAAEQLGRKCYGVEISPAYCDVIVERWENLTGGKATRK